MGTLILVGEVAARTRQLDIRCRRCERFGRLSMQRLLAELGPNAPVYRGWERLNADCPRRDSVSPYEQCSLNAPQLSGMF